MPGETNDFLDGVRPAPSTPQDVLGHSQPMGRVSASRERSSARYCAKGAQRCLRASADPALVASPPSARQSYWIMPSRSVRGQGGTRSFNTPAGVICAAVQPDGGSDGQPHNRRFRKVHCCRISAQAAGVRMPGGGRLRQLIGSMVAKPLSHCRGPEPRCRLTGTVRLHPLHGQAIAAPPTNRLPQLTP